MREQPTQSTHQRAAWIILFLGAALLTTGALLLRIEPHPGWETATANLFAAPQPQNVINAAMFATNPTHFALIVAALCTIAAFFAPRRALLLGLVVLTAAICNDEVIKPLAGRHYKQSLLYPSGHATAAALLGVTLVTSVWWITKNRTASYGACALALSYTAFVSWVLLAERYHHPLDLLGSYAWVSVVAASLYLVATRNTEEARDEKKMAKLRPTKFVESRVTDTKMVTDFVNDGSADKHA